MHTQKTTGTVWLSRIKQCCLPVLVAFLFQSCNAMSSSGHNAAAAADTIPPQLLTVARVWEDPADSSAYTVTFFQSARLYRLPKITSGSKTALELLQQSQKSNQPVQVYLTVQHGDTIAAVKPAGNKQ